MRSSIALLALAAASAHAAPAWWPGCGRAWHAAQFNSLVVFGDSYSDETRLGYFINHNGSAPPPGLLLPETFNGADGGRMWSRYVVQYTGQTVNGQWDPHMTLYNYAVSGAVCSNEITPRLFPAIHGDFPSIIDYEVPAFLADKAADRINTTEPFFTPALTATDAVYAIFIGTNDLGVGAFLTQNQVPGVVLANFTDCVYQTISELYAAGARYFVLFNTAPLNLAPIYANDTLMAPAVNQYWANKPAGALNHSYIAETVHEEVTSVNDIFKYQTPYEVEVTNAYPGASIANFDVWQLMSDIYDNPSAYLNGTQPANVTGYENHCEPGTSGCTMMYNGTSPDSFMWFDPLHPSEQTERIIATNFIDVLNGNSKYATYWTSNQCAWW